MLTKLKKVPSGNVSLSSQPKSPAGRFAGLEGLRGLAALAVVIYHICLPLHVMVAEKAYLAVDFFFVLSGLVIANAYEGRLRQGMQFWKFFRTRLCRLYPLFFLGTAMGVAVTALKAVVALHGAPVKALVAPLVSGLLMLPFFGDTLGSPTQFVFPFNGAAWSLFFEMLVNFVYAVLLIRFSFTNRLLGAMLAVSAVGLALTIVFHGTVDVGGGVPTFALGIVRTAFSFFLGVAMFRILSARSMPHVRFTGLISMLLLLGVLFYPLGWSSQVLDTAAVFVIFPVLIMLSLSEEPSGRIRSLAMLSGALSYPIYITHFPIMRVFQYIAESRGLSGSTLYGMIMVEIAVIISFSALVWRCYDKPLQAFLRGHAHLLRDRRHTIMPSASR